MVHLKLYCLLLIIVSIATTVSANDEDAGPMNAKLWLEDVDFLDKKIQSIYPGYDHWTGKSQYRAEIESLKTNILQMNDAQIIWGIQKILGLFNDEATYIYPIQERLTDKIMPLKAYWFREGLFITDAVDLYGDLVGKKIAAINNHSMGQIRELMRPILSYDNVHYFDYIFPFYVFLPSLLEYAGVVQAGDDITLITSDGDTVRVEPDVIRHYSGLTRDLPHYRNMNGIYHEGVNYWYEYMADENMLFIQFLSIVTPDNDQGFKSFVDEIEHIMERESVEKLVIDNRYGGGGNGFKLKPLTDMIRKNGKINRWGKLFVLTSRATRGTVMELTSIMELNTRSIFIGEPTGEGVNTVGDMAAVELSNSGIIVNITKIFWPTSFEFDQRKSLEPDLYINYTMDQYIDRLDPWLESAVNYVHPSATLPNMKIDMIDDLQGKYTFSGTTIQVNGGEIGLTIEMKRKIKSFFEIHTSLYLEDEGKLGTDIKDVFFYYTRRDNGDYSFKSMEWKGQVIIPDM